MPKTLLLADDSVTIQKVVGITFANEDIELLTENNGEAALARAREITPDLVLADISMPGLNGYELCAAIKADPGLARVPVILLTGTFESYDEERTRQVGADGHIAKPFEAQALVDLVHATLARPAAAPPPAPPGPDPHEQTVVAAMPAVSPEPARARPAPAPEPPALPSPSSAPAEPPVPDFAFDDFAEPAGSASESTGAASESTRVYNPQADHAAMATADTDAELVTPHSAENAGPLPSIDPMPAPAGSSEGKAAAVDAPGPKARAPWDADPPVDEVLYEETSFLDPRAALPPTQDVEPPTPPDLLADPEPPAPRPGPPALDQIQPPPARADRGALDAPELELREEDSLRGQSHFLGDSSGSGHPDLAVPEIPDDNETTAVRAAQAALDAVSELPDDAMPGHGQAQPDPVPPFSPPPDLAALDEDPADEADGDSAPIVVATPEPGSADLAWAEPVAETGDSITDPAPEPASFLEPQPVEPGTDTATTVAATVDPDDLRAALEKLAWEAFGSLSEELVNETVRRVEAIAWEVLPQLAEKLIREEIEKLKSGGDS